MVNYQDLLFGPVDGTLSLLPLIMNKDAVKNSIGSGVAASVQALGVTSILFTGIGGVGPVGNMSPTSATSRGD
jgi:hypothetical protein